MAKMAACLTLYWLKFNVALENDSVSESYLWPGGETSRSAHNVDPLEPPVITNTNSILSLCLCEAVSSLKAPADILESTQFSQHFYPHINQLQIPWLIVFGQSASPVCYKQMPVGSGGGGSRSLSVSAHICFKQSAFWLELK